MKKNLSKKISLLLCSTFLLTNIMGSSFVYANPTDSGDARKTVSARKRPRPSGSQENSSEKRAHLNAAEAATGEEGRGMSTPKKTANKERKCPDAPKKSGLKPSLEVQVRQRKLSKRFLYLFTEMCQMHRIDYKVYSGISDVRELFYKMCLRERLFVCHCFKEFKVYLRQFLESLERESDITEIIFMSVRLNDFAFYEVETNRH